MSWNVWNRPSGSFMVDMEISPNIMKSLSSTMTPSIDQTLHQFANLLSNLTLLPILTLFPNFGGLHWTLQWVRLANSSVRWIGCLTSQLTICQSNMWLHIDVQAGWRSWTYGRAPNAIDISHASFTCPSKHRHGANLFIRWFRHTTPISRL